MSKLKALILGLLLLVPIFVFIFIYTFGEHHFSLRTYFPQLTENGEVVRNVDGDTVFQQVPAFTFTDQAGGTFSQKNLQDKVYVVGFINADCPDNCKQLLSQLVRVQEGTQHMAGVTLLTITDKPVADTANYKLNNLVNKFKADTSRWHFLTGEQDDIYTLASQGFRLSTPDTYSSGPGIDSGKLILVDKENYVRGVYNGTDIADVDRLILEINVLLDEYSKRK